jgi:paraquat-inducible protein A
MEAESNATASRLLKVNMVAPESEYIACHECDLINSIRDVPHDATAKCRQCGAQIYRDIQNSTENALWLSIASAILIVLANTFPIFTFKLEGQEQVASIVTGVQELYRQGFWQLAGLVLLCSIVAPLIRIWIGIYIFLSFRLRRTPKHLASIFRAFEALGPWSMMEVFLLGLIVAYVKLSSLATIIVGVACYSFIAMIFVTTWLSASIEPRDIWSRLSANSARLRLRLNSSSQISRAGYISCHVCDEIIDTRNMLETPGRAARCPRCNATLHKRKPNSIAGAWAFLIAAAICYIPANLLPIMTVISFGNGDPDTILSGVKALIKMEMYPIAILVFVASIFVPILKICVLAYLLISVQVGSKWRPRERTILYRITETIGRWSMLDIFMISILASLVKLGSIATIEPGPGAVFFAAVVVLTMISAASFDPRLIWDMAYHERK